MAFDPARYRLRSQTAGDRETHETSDVRMTDGFARDAKPQTPPRPHHDRPFRDGAITSHGGSTEPQVLEGVTPAAKNVDQGCYSNLAQTMYTNHALVEDNKYLKGENRNLDEAARVLSEENRQLHQLLHNLRMEVDHKSSECNGLKAEVNGLMEKINAAANQGPLWSLLGNLLPGTRDSHKSVENAIAEMQMRLADYERRFGEQEAENRKLQHKIAEQKQQMQLQTTRFAEELEALRSKSCVNTANLSDTEIQGKWRALCFSVKQFVSVHLPESLDPSTTQDLAGWFNWLPEPLVVQTLQAALFCPTLLESLIWHFLSSRIFDSCSRHWAGADGEDWGMLYESFRGCLSGSGDSHPSAATVAEFHDWRVRSAHFISNLAGRSPDFMVPHEARNLFSVLEPVTRGDISHDMHRDAQEIMRQATELAALFRLSRADFQVFITRVKPPLVDPPKFGFKFDSETMEQVKIIPISGQHASDPIVDLAVSPGLFKAGNSDGSHYHQERVLVKLQALCDLQPTLRFLEERRMSVEEGGRH